MHTFRRSALCGDLDQKLNIHTFISNTWIIAVVISLMRFINVPYSNIFDYNGVFMSPLVPL